MTSPMPQEGSFLVLDLETVVDASLPALPESADGKDVFPPIPYHQIVVMGAALLDPSYRVRRTWVVGEGKNELGMLTALTSFLNEHHAQKKPITAVGFNSRGFDMPVLMARCLRYGLAAPWYYQPRDVRYRYSTSGHFDLMDFLTDYGGSRAYGLDLAARLVGSCGKLGVHGNDVAKMIADGQLEQVRSYCLSDVAQTASRRYRQGPAMSLLDIRPREPARRGGDTRRSVRELCCEIAGKTYAPSRTMSVGMDAFSAAAVDPVIASEVPLRRARSPRRRGPC